MHLLTVDSELKTFAWHVKQASSKKRLGLGGRRRKSLSSHQSLQGATAKGNESLARKIQIQMMIMPTVNKTDRPPRIGLEKDVAEKKGALFFPSSRRRDDTAVVGRRYRRPCPETIEGDKRPLMERQEAPTSRPTRKWRGKINLSAVTMR